MYIDKSGRSETIAQQALVDLSQFLPWLIGGISTGLTAAQTAIASSWMPTVALIAATVAVVSIAVVVNKAIEYSEDAERTRTWVYARVSTQAVDKNKTGGHTVYVITEISTGKVVYVGRTVDFTSRQYKHQKYIDTKYYNDRARFPEDDYTMTPVVTDLSKDNARAWEHSLITAFTIGALENIINAIAEKKLYKFEDELKRVGTLISGYYEEED